MVKWLVLLSRPWRVNLWLGKRQSVRKSMICIMKNSMTNPREPSHSEIWTGHNRSGWKRSFKISRCHGWKGTGFVWQPHMVREEIVFGHDKCLCMRAYVEHRRVDTQQAQEQIGATKCGKGSVCQWQPHPQEGYVAIQTSESHMGLADTHQWTGPTHKRARCGRFRWSWHWFWHQHSVWRPTLIERVVGFSFTHNEECLETVSSKYKIINIAQ